MKNNTIKYAETFKATIILYTNYAPHNVKNSTLALIENIWLSEYYATILTKHLWKIYPKSFFMSYLSILINK